MVVGEEGDLLICQVLDTDESNIDEMLGFSVKKS